MRRESYFFPFGNIQGSRREFSWSSTSTFYAKRLRDVRFEDTRIENTGLSRKELLASREDCYELSKELRRDILLAHIPIGLFSPTACSFQLLPFGFLLSVAFLYEKRSVVSFPPDVALSKDTGEHWTLLHEIYSYVSLRVRVRTFFKQLSIFEGDNAKCVERNMKLYFFYFSLAILLVRIECDVR